MSAVVAAMSVLLLAFAGTAGAAVPQRLSEIVPSTVGSSPTAITDVNGKAYFAVSEGSTNSLWTSDGTEGGTEQVSTASVFGDLVVLGETVYFPSSDSGFGVELWESDGTEAGTQIAGDINAGAANSFPLELTVVGDTLFFAVQDDTEYGSELWKVEEGGEPELVADVRPGPEPSSPRNLEAYAGKLYFSAYDEEHGTELWESDGTEPGTKLADDIFEGTESSSPGDLRSAGGALYFTAYDETHGREVWKFETGGEAELVQDAFPGPESSFPSELTPSASGLLYFVAYDGESSFELWVSGSGGTKVVEDIYPGEYLVPAQLTDVSGTLYFAFASPAGGTELWSSDGTEAGTDAVKQINPSMGQLNELTKVGSALFFTADDGIHGSELWSSDGTEGGTKLVEDVVPGEGSSTPGGLADVGGTLFLSAVEMGYGSELFVSDGTEAGTHLVKDIETKPQFPISEISASGGLVYFVAEDRTNEAGQELWVSDSTEDGTKLVEDIVPGSAGSNPKELTNVNGTLFFVINDPGISPFGNELWTSDGTEAGTHLVKEFEPFYGSIYELVNVQGTLFFAARDEAHADELWSSDGSEEGTKLVKDVNPTAGSNPTELSDAGGLLLFVADDGTHGPELWRSDGTESGTEMVKDINPTGTLGQRPLWRIPPFITRRLYGLPMYFGADDGVHGFELWRTDGTEAGTELLKDITPEGSTGILTGFLRFESHTFFVSSTPDTGLEPWQTDGTEAGTHIAKDIYPGSVASAPTDRAVSKGVIYFNADDGTHGDELWRSDGTVAGTKLVKDINPGSAASFVGGTLPIFQELTSLNGELYFSAEDGVHGEELWQSGGTEANTQQVTDLNAGPAPSSPRELVTSGISLFFSADDGTGRQLWTVESALPDDTDEDGIADDVDTEPATASDAFSDKAATSGAIVGGRNGLDVTIADASIVDGVNIKVGPGSGGIEIAACAGFTIKVKAGTEADLTCGSVRVEVITGEAEVILEDGETVVFVPAGASAKVTEEEDGSFKIENLGGGDVIVTTDGEETTIEPGDPPLVLEPPTAVGDTLKLSEDAAATAVDVLGNDEDPDGGEMTIESVGAAEHGTVAVTGGGTGLTYKPTADYCGSDSFKYNLNGGSQATVSVTVDCVDDAPTAAADSANLTEDDPATAVPVLTNDPDIDGGPKAIESTGASLHGTVAVTGGGTGLTYKPAADYCGPDSFTYTLNGGSSATVTVAIACVDDPPSAVADTAGVNEDAAATAIPVLANDTDTDGGAMSVASVGAAGHGTVAITGAGTGLTYKPAADYCGADAFTYVLSGGSQATVTMTVACLDDLPGAADDTASIKEDDPATAVPVLANDTDIDAGAKTIASTTAPAHGTVAITGGGTGLTYKPAADYCGPDTFTYTLNGGASATVSVTVACVDDPPAAKNDNATLGEDAGATAIGVLSNDSDIDGGPRAIASAGGAGHGSVAVTGGGSGLVFTPAPDYCGSDNFTYALNGGGTATVSVTVTCVDDPPLALRDAITIREDSGKAKIRVLANDTDIDGGPFAIASVTKPRHGKSSIAGSRIGYKPKRNFCGKDTFAYVLNGGATASIAVKVKCRPH